MADTVEYGRRHAEPEMFATPTHAAFGRAETVDDAVRALGFGL